MALKLDFAPTERIILKDESVAHGGVMSVNDDELILTTLKIIYIKKNVFGMIQGVYYYPLNRLKQAVQGKLTSGTATLDLYFFNDVESFNFGSANSRKIKKWIKEIYNVTDNITVSSVSNTESPYINTSRNLLNQFSEIGKQIKNTVTSNNESIKVSKKCIGCSAPLVGKKGEVVRCKYCDTDQSI